MNVTFIVAKLLHNVIYSGLMYNIIYVENK